MPTVVHKSQRKGGGFDIVEKSTGKVKGHSATKKNAQKSANVRNAIAAGTWRPTKKGGRR